MTHTSSKELDPVLLNKLFNRLIVVLNKAKSANNLAHVVDELFTYSEKIMFTKRLSIILMLIDRIPQHRIVNVLQVSPSTVAKISLNIEIGKYENIVRITEVEKINIEKIVWGILTVGGIMPPKIGKKYWKKYSK